MLYTASIHVYTGLYRQYPCQIDFIQNENRVGNKAYIFLFQLKKEITLALQMGVLKLAYTEEKSPLKIAYRREEKEAEKVVQWFISTDPMAHERVSWSPYNYCSGDPINRTDPDGALDGWVPDGNGGAKYDNDPNVGAKTASWIQEGGEHDGQMAHGNADGTTSYHAQELGTVEVSAKRTTSASSNQASNTAAPATNSQSYNGAQVAAFSTSQDGKYKYNYGSPARPLGTISPTAGKSQFDCSAWVYYCLSQSYPGLAKAIGSNTSSIKSYAQGHGGVRTNNPAVGDLALWQGHVEIVTGVNGQAFNTSGASGRSGSPIPSAKSFTGINDKAIKWYGNGTFVGFWTPQIPVPKLQVPKFSN